jgi:hypothetical protein
VRPFGGQQDVNRVVRETQAESKCCSSYDVQMTRSLRKNKLPRSDSLFGSRTWCLAYGFSQAHCTTQLRRRLRGRQSECWFRRRKKTGRQKTDALSGKLRLSKIIFVRRPGAVPPPIQGAVTVRLPRSDATGEPIPTVHDMRVSPSRPPRIRSLEHPRMAFRRPGGDGRTSW